MILSRPRLLPFAAEAGIAPQTTEIDNKEPQFGHIFLAFRDYSGHISCVIRRVKGITATYIYRIEPDSIVVCQKKQR
jgi:hypothetical protein